MQSQLDWMTNFMEQNPSWEANTSSDNQEISRTLWRPEVHYLIHKIPPPVPNFKQTNPLHVCHPTYWRSILILLSHLRLVFPCGPTSSILPTKILYAPLLSPYVLHVLPLYSSLFDHPNSVWCRTEIIKLLIVRYSAFPPHLHPLRPKYQHPILWHPQLMFLPQ